MLDEAAALAALADAGDEIDGYLSGRYTVPLNPVPRILTHLCVDIAMHKGAIGTMGTDGDRRRYEDAVRFLSKLAEGKIRLGQPAADESPNRDGLQVAAPAREFGPALLGKY